MTRDEVIKLADEYLKSMPDIRKKIRRIDVELKKRTYTSTDIENLKNERHRLHSKLSRIIRAINVLDEKNQKIICYRYFDKRSYTNIALEMGLSRTTIPRRIEKGKLKVGRILFGFEDEYWRVWS